MTKTILILLASTLAFTSCVKEKAVQPLTPKQVQQKIDSIIAAKSKDITSRGQRDLNYRMKIEVKGKADSMMRAHQKKADSVATPKL